MRIKRGLKLGDYDTAANGWTLCAWALGSAPQKTNYVEKTGGDGSWDLSTALTDGLLRYGDRDFSATLECSEGDRLHREAIIAELVNTLDGARVRLELPDDKEHYLVGRLSISKSYNDMAHCSVAISATCEPWKYRKSDTVVRLTAATEQKKAELVNHGRRAVVPTITVSGPGASVLLSYGSKSISSTAATFKWAELLLTPGIHDLTYSGAGSIEIRYQEAVLE